MGIDRRETGDAARSKSRREIRVSERRRAEMPPPNQALRERVERAGSCRLFLDGFRCGGSLLPGDDQLPQSLVHQWRNDIVGLQMGFGQERPVGDDFFRFRIADAGKLLQFGFGRAVDVDEFDFGAWLILFWLGALSVCRRRVRFLRFALGGEGWAAGQQQRDRDQCRLDDARFHGVPLVAQMKLIKTNATGVVNVAAGRSNLNRNGSAKVR